MGNGYVLRFSSRTVRLILTGLLLAWVTFSARIYPTGDDVAIKTPAAIAVDHTGGSTGGG